VQQLRDDGVLQVGPTRGDLACGEEGQGRLAEVPAIVEAVEDFFAGDDHALHAPKDAGHPLSGKRAVVTAGPTFEAIDPVRFIGNRSSGRQGYAIAEALARLGADVLLVSGPTALPDPHGVKVVRVESAAQMLEALTAGLPADIAICVAAVADWRAKAVEGRKIKKGKAAPQLDLIANPDILARISEPGENRPPLVVGFAAETDNVVANGQAKLATKGCDWIVANDVAAAHGAMGGEENAVHLITPDGVEDWPLASKMEVAQRLADRISDQFKTKQA
jgi:phosphopantothenoylcysteine decarboxylase/phosphopantothenate--cysteine ligase